MVDVTTRAELDAALATATGGETIRLAPGDYGDLALNGRTPADWVTLTSRDAARSARLRTVQLDGCRYLRFEALTVAADTDGGFGSGFVDVLNSQHIELLSCEVHGSEDQSSEGAYAVRFKDTNDIKCNNNYLHDCKDGVVIFAVSRGEVSYNSFNFCASDSMKFGGVFDLLIEGNFAGKTMFPSPEAHIDFIQFQGNSTRCTLRKNVMLLDEHPINTDNGSSKVYQGLFISNGIMNDLLVEHNMIRTNTLHGIGVWSEGAVGQNITIRNNLSVANPHLAKFNGTAIRLDNLDNVTVTDNITDIVWYDSEDPPEVLSGNLRTGFQQGDPVTHYDDVIVNNSEPYARLDDLRLTAQTIADYPGIGPTVLYDDPTFGAQWLANANTGDAPDPDGTSGTDTGGGTGGTGGGTTHRVVYRLASPLVSPAATVSHRLPQILDLQLGDGTLLVDFEAEQVTGVQRLVTHSVGDIRAIDIALHDAEVRVAVTGPGGSATMASGASVQAGTRHRVVLSWTGSGETAWLDGTQLGATSVGLTLVPPDAPEKTLHRLEVYDDPLTPGDLT